MLRCAVRRAAVGSRLRASKTSMGRGRAEPSNALSGNNSKAILSEIQANRYRTSLSSVKLYSSKPSHDEKSNSSKESPESSVTSDTSEAPIETEAISLFFEKRKAALAKGKQEKEEHRGDSANFKNGSNRPMTSNHRHGKNERRQSSNFQQRQRQNQYPKQNRQQQHDRRRGDNSNADSYERPNNLQGSNSGGKNQRNPEGLSDVLQGMSRQRDGRRNQFDQKQNNRNRDTNSNRLSHQGQKDNSRFNARNQNDRNKNYTNRNNQPEGTLRLAEMMKKLRKDAPPNMQQDRSDQASSPRFSRHNKDARASWRQKRFAMPLSEDGNNERRGRSNNRHSGRGQRSPQAEEFLQGRISRTDDGDIPEDVKSEATSIDRVVTLPVNNSLSLSEVSLLFRVKLDDIKEKLRDMGVPSEDGLDVDVLELLAMEFGIETVRSTNEPAVVDSEQLLMQQRRSDTVSDAALDASMIDLYPPRPPIVTIMGHVDHGKTTLMDALRRRSQEQQNGKKGSASKSTKKKGKKSKNASDSLSKNIAGTEAGGITQIISAFQVALEGQDDKITFLDTPGHAAFRAMRQSGSHAADVIVLVVAADDGISEQTVEIIEFYKSIVKGSSDSGISMVVAVNKIDKPGIDAEEAQMRIENQLLEHGIVSEGMSTEGSEYGQPVQVIPTSGITGEGLDDLMEGLLLQSEIMDLRACDKSNGEGIIMDARQEKGLGVVADCIVRWGNIEKGSVMISGDQVSQVRMLKDVNNKMIKSGLPSQPVRIVGFKSLPKAGDPLMIVESEEIAEQMLEQRRALDLSTSERPDGSRSDVELHITGMRRGDTWRVKKFTNKAAIEESDGTVRIPIIVKADADGSLAAVRDSLLNIGDDSKHAVVIDPIMEGIGEVTPSDILMAKESEATIFSFGSIRVDQSTMNLAEAEGVSICSNNIIYSLLDEAKVVLGSYLPLISKEHTHGRAAVKAIFSIDTENGEEKIAGLNVLEGNIYKSKAPLSGEDSSTTVNADCHFRIYRDGKLISPDDQSVTASSLRRFKELVESVRLGDECGLGLSGFTDFEEGDEIECYSVEMKKAKL
mmetsp:Transcript_20232/g.50328  ORF Transcript_20232/g.50328 Transcript_20232/m.50328 type:complete len:1070 (+) Transcript_20232:95-3304(+)